MRVLVAMSGGVDSSVAASLLIEQGHEVVGATMKLWGGPSDSGCCSVADVEDARRVAQQLGVKHHIFNFTEEFDDLVVEPYVSAHAAGETPNPCVECNRHLKFDKFIRRAEQLGFDAIATGHHARVVAEPDGRFSLRRGRDVAKDQSYVLSMLGQRELARVLLPVGEMTKGEVRERARVGGLRTAAKPDSQEVCFIRGTKGGRRACRGDRIPLRAGPVLESDGTVVGAVDALELVSIGQRRGLGSSGSGAPHYAVDVDTEAGTVTVGPESALLTGEISLRDVTWSAEPLEDGDAVLVQSSAHGTPVVATLLHPGPFGHQIAGYGQRSDDQNALRWVLRLAEPRRRVAPGQTVALYVDDEVVGAGIASAGASATRAGAHELRDAE